jgi:L-lactate dehydrogenase
MRRSSALDSNKVSIVGAGKVGITAAYTLLVEGLANEIVLWGRDREKVTGEALDLQHALPYTHEAKIIPTDSYGDLKNSDIIFFTAGAAQTPGQTRLDLAKTNVAIVEDMIPKIVKAAPGAIIVMVTNPVDVLTYKAAKIAGLPYGQVFGSGTTLDTARFRFNLSEVLNIAPASIHAYVLGEHGDSSFPVVSSAEVGGQPIRKLAGFSAEAVARAYDDTRDAAANIIQAKGATFYGVATAIKKITNVILRDAKSVLPVTTPLEIDYYGVSGVALSVPCVIGRRGIERVLMANLSEEEKRQFRHSAEVVKSFL